MLKVCPIASGSNGNCTYISDGKVNILIDAGISATRIIRELSTLCVAASEIDAIFITHEHGDHITGLLKLLDRTDATVYASEGTVRGINERVPGISHRLECILPDGEKPVGELKIRAFRTPHDTYESTGFTVCSQNERATVATDIGCVTDELLQKLMGADILLLESNYDKRRLHFSKYPQFLKDRICGGCGHLSNDECANVARLAVESGTKNIILGHISAENNSPKEAYTAVHTHLTQNGIIPGVDMMLYVATRDRRGEIVEVRK